LGVITEGMESKGEEICDEGTKGCGSDHEVETEPTWNCHSVQVCPCTCSKLTIQEMSTAEIFIVPHSTRINNAGYSNFSCPSQSLVRVPNLLIIH
jgi:hypothetical protein